LTICTIFELTTGRSDGTLSRFTALSGLMGEPVRASGGEASVLHGESHGDVEEDFAPTAEELKARADERRLALLGNVLCWFILGTIVAASIALAAVFGSTPVPISTIAKPVCSWPLVCETNGLDQQMDLDFRNQPRIVYAKNGVVAADHSRCAEIGKETLEKGGHAVDAAVATSLCQGVLNPFASGLGGGMFMVVKDGDSIRAMNGREVAPGAADAHMFDGMPPEASRIGGLAIGVPMALKGLHSAWSQYGKLPWSDLVTPAAHIAEYGFAMHPYFRRLISGDLDRLRATPALRDVYLIKEKIINGSIPTWRLPEIGEYCCKNYKLAESLEKIAHVGGQAFMDSMAETFANEIQALGGIITKEDIIKAQPVWTDAMTQTMGSGERAMNISYVPPPSGGALVALALRILANMSDFDTIDSHLADYRTLEALRNIFAVRLSLGDPGTLDVPHYDITSILEDLKSDAYVESLRSAINDTQVQADDAYGGKWNIYANAPPPDDPGTCHFSIIDGEGNAVALTTSINGDFGSFVVSPSAGIVWNNHMDDFTRPDSNTYGLPPGVPNFIAPGKRPMSSMSPIIVTQNGEIKLVAGGNGGPLIMSAVVQVASKFLLRKQSLIESVKAIRFHSQIIKYSCLYENYTAGSAQMRASPEQVDFMLSKGYANVTPLSFYIGNVQTATVMYNPANPVTKQLKPVFIVGVSDARKDGAPAGY
jgi:gamma-glutamyltranspeptidase/glutathione hydrolase/leukotriene-C4 hydrolase